MSEALQEAVPSDLTTFILAEVHRQTSEDALRKIVETKIGDTVKSAVNDAFHTWGDVGKQITKAVANSLSIGDRLDLPSYSNMVMALLRTKLDETVSDLVNNKLAAEMADILKLAPKEIKFSEIVAALVEHKKEFSDQGYGEVTCVIDDSSSSVGYYRVGLDEEKNTKMYSCAVQFAVDKEGKIYTLSINQKDVKKTVHMGPYYNYEKMVFAAYACGSTIIMDDSDPSTTFGDD